VAPCWPPSPAWPDAPITPASPTLPWKPLGPVAPTPSAANQQTPNSLAERGLHTTYNRSVHTFNGPLSGTTQVSRYQKGKTNMILLKQETVSGSGISWAIMQVCTSLQTDNHASTPPLSFYRPDVLPANQPTASKQ